MNLNFSSNVNLFKIQTACAASTFQGKGRWIMTKGGDWSRECRHKKLWGLGEQQPWEGRDGAPTGKRWGGAVVGITGNPTRGGQRAVTRRSTCRARDSWAPCSLRARGTHPPLGVEHGLRYTLGNTSFHLAHEGEGVTGSKGGILRHTCRTGASRGRHSSCRTPHKQCRHLRLRIRSHRRQ